MAIYNDKVYWRIVDSFLVALDARTGNPVWTVSIAILQFEITADGNIKTAENAMWWTMSTMTMMDYGIGIQLVRKGDVPDARASRRFGTFSGLVASWFLSPAAEEANTELAEIRAILQDATVSRCVDRQPCRPLSLESVSSPC